MQLHYHSSGQGQPLLILHGLFGSLDNWASQAKRLSQWFQVFALDLRNHGLSPKSPEMSYEAMAGDLLEFIDKHGLAAIHLLGHSMGGKTAMLFADRYPERVLKLVVADIGPREYREEHRQILDALLGINLSAHTSRASIEAALSENVPDKAVRQFLLKSVSHDNAGAFHWKLNLSALSTNYDRLRAALDLRKGFPGPALFLRGAESDYLRTEDMSSIRHFFPEARLVEIPGAGHWLHAERPEEFFRAVIQFLQSDP